MGGGVPEIFIDICNLLRPILFFSLLGYIPMKLGIGFDVASKAPSTNEVREERNVQVKKILSFKVVDVFLIPIRLLTVIYFTIWLLIDMRPLLVVSMFLLTLLPVYFK